MIVKANSLVKTNKKFYLNTIKCEIIISNRNLIYLLIVDFIELMLTWILEYDALDAILEL